MPFTLADLANLDNAIKSGAERLDYPDGGGLTYRSAADLLKLRETVIADLISQGLLPAGGGSASGAGVVTQSLGVTSRR